MHAPRSSLLTSALLTSDLPAIAADIFARLCMRRPRVHCITNSVAQNFTANVLLAVGAVPSMTVAPDEIAEFVARADALLMDAIRSSGVPDAVQRERMPRTCVSPGPACASGAPLIRDRDGLERSTQVGFNRLAHIKAPISDKPEIGFCSAPIRAALCPGHGIGGI
jgi:hydroxyethylthiazole kinase